MEASDRRRMRVNHPMWDESGPLHLVSRDYDLPRFKKRGWAIHALESGGPTGPKEDPSPPSVALRADTLPWARLGARVTGVDFSLPAIAAVERLARKIEVNARCIESNVYDLTTALRTSKFRYRHLELTHSQSVAVPSYR